MRKKKGERRQKHVLIAMATSLFVFMGIFSLLIYVHEDEHQEVCGYFGGNASDITIQANGNIGIYCYDVKEEYRSAERIAQSNIESNELSIIPYSFICMMLVILAMMPKGKE